LPEGAEWGKSYPLNDHFNSNDVDELKYWTKEQRTSSMDITSEDKKKDKVIKKEVIKEYIKLPKYFKKLFNDTLKHARRRGEKIPPNIDRFFED